MLLETIACYGYRTSADFQGDHASIAARSLMKACREELFEELVKEREELVAKRVACLAVLQALRAALQAIDLVQLPAPLSSSSHPSSASSRMHSPIASEATEGAWSC